jgi:acyl dehydratase
MREIEQRGLYYDEFETDVKYLHRPGRTVTEADNVIFTTLTMNTQALHLDAAWSEQQEFGQRLVNSMFTLSTVIGMSVAQLTQGTIVANLGFSEVAFPHPVHHGDTLYAETTLLEKRLSASRPGQGIVTLSHLGRNQHGVTVVRAIRTTLVWTQEGLEKKMRDTGPARPSHRSRDDGRVRAGSCAAVLPRGPARPPMPRRSTGPMP